MATTGQVERTCHEGSKWVGSVLPAWKFDGWIGFVLGNSAPSQPSWPSGPSTPPSWLSQPSEPSRQSRPSRPSWPSRQSPQPYQPSRLSWPSQSLTTPTTRQRPKYHQTYRHRPNTGLTASHWHQHRFSMRNNTIRTSTWMKAQGYKTLKWGQHDHHMPQKCRHVDPTYCTLPRK